MSPPLTPESVKQLAQADIHLTTPQAALYLNISSRTLDKSRTTGEGPSYVKLGRAVRYPIAFLDKWKNARVQHSASESKWRLQSTFSRLIEAGAPTDEYDDEAAQIAVAVSLLSHEETIVAIINLVWMKSFELTADELKLRLPAIMRVAGKIIWGETEGWPWSAKPVAGIKQIPTEILLLSKSFFILSKPIYCFYG